MSDVDGRIPDLTDEVSIIGMTPKFVGTYSYVFKGKYNGETVAIKVLRELSVSLHAMRRKVKRERLVWARMRHPNVVPLYGYTEEGETFGSFGALISPWYNNGDARKFLHEHGAAMTLDERRDLWQGVIAGVCYLHELTPQVIHGDLKPGNILIDDTGIAKICDFGLVRIILEEGESGITTTSDHTGTDRYLSRELVTTRSPASLSAASDVYALGCIGLDFLFLQIPYAHRKNNYLGEIFQDIRNGIPPALRPNDASSDLSHLWTILEACWNLGPWNRPTCRTILEELADIKRDAQLPYIQQSSKRDTISRSEGPKTDSLTPKPLATQTDPTLRNKRSLLVEMLGRHPLSPTTTKIGSGIASKKHRVDGFEIDKRSSQDLFDNESPTFDQPQARFQPLATIHEAPIVPSPPIKSEEHSPYKAELNSSVPLRIDQLIPPILVSPLIQSETGRLIPLHRKAGLDPDQQLSAIIGDIGAVIHPEALPSNPVEYTPFHPENRVTTFLPTNASHSIGTLDLREERNPKQSISGQWEVALVFCPYCRKGFTGREKLDFHVIRYHPDLQPATNYTSFRVQPKPF